MIQVFLRIAVAIAILVSGMAGAQPTADLNSGGWTLEGSITDRDNTRVLGTVYDSEGNPQPKVVIWVANNQILSSRVRIRTRSDGSFLVRDIAQLYTQEDVLGIVLRLSFEKEGYEPLEVTVAVERNALAEVHPILWRPEETPQGNDWCIVVQGTVSAAGRKRVKKALVTITSPLDPGFELQAKVGKNGTYRALLWNAPSSLKISATAAGFSSVESTLILEGAPRTNMVAQVAQNLVLAP